MASPPLPIRVLTVGDGDLTASLALARALGPQIDLTATTFVSEAELTATYALAGPCLAELRERGVRVQHGVDATALSAVRPGLALQHHVLFYHPHLGLGDLKDSAAHHRRHSVLVAHYLASAAAMLLPGGVVHLTLCGNQATTWSAAAHARRLGLLSVQALPTTSAAALLCGPMAEAGCGRSGPGSGPGAEGGGGTPLAPPRPEWASRRRFRDGALGSKHWLARYGYEHRRTHGDVDMRVGNSVELVYRSGKGSSGGSGGGGGSGGSGGSSSQQQGTSPATVCGVCGYDWETAEGLASHVRHVSVYL